MTETKLELIKQLSKVITALSVDELRIILSVAEDIQTYGKSQPATTQKLGKLGR